MQIAFIAGMGHSGSTLLNILLGQFRQTISVGEIDKIINPVTREIYLNRYIYQEKYPCSCGEPPRRCPYWSVFIESLLNNYDKRYSWHYLKAVEIAKDRFQSAYFIDASKNIHALRRVYAAVAEGGENTELFVLHLVKDARNRAYSDIRSTRLNSILKSYKKWVVQNNAFEKYITEQNLPSLNIGYEELAISTSRVLADILAFLGIPGEDALKQMKPSESHILFGNNMRLNDRKSTTVEYDYGWLTSLKIPFLYSLYPGLHRKNIKWCYTHLNKHADR